MPNPAPDPGASGSAEPECERCVWFRAQRDRHPSGSAANNIYEAALSQHRHRFHPVDWQPVHRQEKGA